MRENRLWEAIGEVDERYIAQAAPKKRRSWPVYFAAAACLLLIVTAGAFFLRPSKATPELPMLTISVDTGTMGYEGYMAYSIDELCSGNPWQEATAPQTLPVYQNPLSYDAVNDILYGGDFTAMETQLRAIAARLGLDPDTLVITDNAPDEEEMAQIAEKLAEVGETLDDMPEGYYAPTALLAESNDIALKIDMSMATRITFDPAAALPDGYNFNHFASYEDTLRVAEYLIEAYKDLLQMKDPQISITGGDRNIYGQQNYRIEVYDAAGSDNDRIESYAFDRVSFHCDDEGKLSMIWVYCTDRSQKVGDYPIITTEEAETLLEEGHYITSVPYTMPGLEYIRRVELVYRTSKYDAYFMPYYRFYVELPEATFAGDTGCKDFGAYYVPAVESEYLTELPVWDIDAPLLY